MSQTLKTYGLLILLALTACKKDASWNSAWVVPLINDRIGLDKFVNILHWTIVVLIMRWI
ncbi:MAG: hypothetical protein R2779_06160 [Crocinitomicaceae bacterium]